MIQPLLEGARKNTAPIDTAQRKGYGAEKKMAGIKWHIAVNTQGCRIRFLPFEATA